MSRLRPITIVGIGDDGCAGLSSRAVGAVSAAQVLAGSERHLAFFPRFRGERIVFKEGLGRAFDRVAEAANENNVCILASGDPMFFGVGAAVIKRLGAEHVEILPHPSLDAMGVRPGRDQMGRRSFHLASRPQPRRLSYAASDLREVRLLLLAAMRIRRDGVVWDIGAGSGSVSIEAAMLAPYGRVYAIEVDPEGVEICRENLRTHAIDNVRVIAGRAPEVLAELETPDAVFVGGSKGSLDEIVEVTLERLRPGGRLVANAITLENSAEVYTALRKRGIVPEVTLLQIARAEPLARYLRFKALNPIQIFAAEKPAGGGEAR